MKLQTRVGHPKMGDSTVAGSSLGHLRLVCAFKRLRVGRRRRASGVSRAVSVGGILGRLEAIECLLGLRKTPINGGVRLDSHLRSSRGYYLLFDHR